jgi:hypothetical protein
MSEWTVETGTLSCTCNSLYMHLIRRLMNFVLSSGLCNTILLICPECFSKHINFTWSEACLYWSPMIPCKCCHHTENSTKAFHFCVWWGGPTQHISHFWPIVPAPGDCEDGEFGGMEIDRETKITQRKPAPAPLCPPHIPLDQTRAWTRTALVGSKRLTTWAMVWLTYTFMAGLLLC